MADMQRLMDVVRRLEAQGINVVDFLEGQVRMPAEQPFNGMDISGRPMPEFQPFTGPGPGAVVDDSRFSGMGMASPDLIDRIRRSGYANPNYRGQPQNFNQVAGLLQMLGGR
jgi:hypothetical protein